MTSSNNMRQVDGVGFSLAGKVGKRERVRIESAVEDYIRRNYDLIRSHFNVDQAAVSENESTTAGVRLCINRISNKVSIVSVNGTDLVAAGGGSVLRTCHRRQRRSATASTPADSSQERESSTKAAGSASTGGAAVVGDKDTGELNGESMEAAIEYLMSRDQRSGGRMLRSSLPSLDVSVANNASQMLCHPPVELQQKQQKQQLNDMKSCLSMNTAAVAAAAAAANARLVGDGYDCCAHGAAFRLLFPTLRGEFFIFYDHGETHCRKMLTSMGFTERQASQEHDEYRGINQMCVMWCNGSTSAAKRKSGLGYHIVNRLRYRGLLTNKCSLVRTLAEFEISHSHLVPHGLEASSFLPPTVHMNGAGAIDIFHKIRNSGMYLIKPGYSDCGKGIVLYRSNGSLTSLIDTLTENYPNYTQKDLVLQKYIENPLLIEGKKFDLRVYLLLVPNQRKEVGVYAFVHPGYARLACRKYDSSSDDLTLHLTNQAVQHRDKTYKTVKEDTVWSPDMLNQYLNEHRVERKVPCEDWVKRKLFPRVRAILGHLVSVVSSSLCDEAMSFELFGCDFLVDDQFNVWLLEVNSDPSLNKSTSVLRQIVTQVVEEAVGLAVEVLQRAVRGMAVKTLATQQDFKKVFSHTNESVLRSVLGQNRIRYPQHFTRG